MFQFADDAVNLSQGATCTEDDERQEERPPITLDESTGRDMTLPMRADCKDGPRPCPLVSCRYHLLKEITVDGSIKVLHRIRRKGAPEILRESASSMRADRFIDDAAATIELIDDTCALDVADEGPANLDRIGQAMGVTREGARLMVDRAHRAMRVARDRADREEEARANSAHWSKTNPKNGSKC